MSDASLWIAPGAEHLARAVGISAVEDAWKGSLPGKVINDRGARQVVEIPLPDLGQTVYLKRWRIAGSGLWGNLGAIQGRAKKEFENLNLLAEIGIRVPRPLFFGEVKTPLGPVATLLVVDGLKDCVCAMDWVKTHGEEKGIVAVGIGKIMGRLHRHECYYRSPGLKHFFVPADYRHNDLALIDVPRVDIHPSAFSCAIRKAIGADYPCPERDLSKVSLTLRNELAASDSHLETFWEAYFEARGSLDDRKALMERVKALSIARSKARSANKHD